MIKICLVCGKEFNSKNKKYCSKPCFYLSERTIIAIPCVVCGKSFKPAQKSRKFCSAKCRGFARRTISSTTCEQCGKIFRPRDNSGRRYCSKNCFDTAQTTILPRECIICHKKFTPNVNTTKTCSKECLHIYRVTKHPLGIHPCICVACGKEFRYRKGQEHCGQRCFLLSTRNKGTKIEHILYEYLDSLDILYEKQYNFTFTIPDVFIPSLNLCVYADGYYWHGKDKVKERDKKQVEKLTELGYNVIRLWEQKDLSLDLVPLKNYLENKLIFSTER